MKHAAQRGRFLRAALRGAEPAFRPIATRAFSSEVGTGSRRENATNQKCRAAFRFDWIEKPL
jgi:hypothetical protein